MPDLAAFRLDPVNQCLWRRNGSEAPERILLTPTEYGVLDHLVEHAGRLVTHRELLDAVWPRTAIEPQAVKSKIFRLRRALDDDPRQPRYIETVARRGYRFVGTLERGMSSDTHAAASAAPAAPVPARRLVGRERALAELRQCLQSAKTGRVQIVFVTGEPGIGKSALVEELQRLVVTSDPTTRIASGQCVEGFGSKEAFYPVLQAIGELCRAPDGDRMVSVLSSHAPTWLVQFPALLTPQHRQTLHQEIIGATRERMLREICEAMEATTASAPPLVLVLEDLHWADSSTLDLISAMARRRVGARIMVVATYRPADVARSAQPLHALKRDLVARHLCREIVLQPLTEPEIAEYLTAGDTAADVPDELPSLLYRHTEGNPLFMVGVIDHLTERGVIERTPGAWRLRVSAAAISLSVPENLRDMIAAQLERLSADEQRVLETAAICGATFVPAICAPTADIDTTAFDDCCDRLARSGQILDLADTQELSDGTVVQRYAFAHTLYREVLYERQSPGRRATLHRRCAERIEAIFHDALDDVTPQLAHHAEKGADWPRAVRYMRRAAVLSARRYGLDDARVSLRRALALAGHLPAAERATTEIAILDALGGMDAVTSHPQVLETLTLLRQRAASYGFAEAEAKALVDFVLPVSRVDAARALDALQEALRLSDTLEPLARARIRAACFARRISTIGWSDTDAAACAEAMDEIRRHCAGRELALHVVDCSFVGFYSSRYRQTLSEVLAAMPILTADHTANTYLDFAVAHWNCDALVPWCLNFVGDWGASIGESDARAALAERNADALRHAMLLILRAWTQLNALDFAGVRALVRDILPRISYPSATFLRRFAEIIGAAADAGLGERVAAVERLGVLRDEMNRRPAMLDWYMRITVQWVLANAWLDAGDLARASAEGDLFLARAAHTAERTWQGLAWEVNARIALQAGDVARASELVESGLAAIDAFEVPVAAWQLHATAAEIARARGDGAAAARQLDASRRVVQGLAQSLGTGDERLRQIFASAPRVAAILRGAP